jgi:acetate---CoA ligase (ADP-forming)
MNPLHNFFYPGSVCIAGAISKENSIGQAMLKSIKNYGYTGKVYPVNPKLRNILGYKCFRVIEEIDEEIDLGIIIVPKEFAESAVDALLSKNVKAIILISAGFEETGKAGEELQNRIVKKINSRGARLVGPNCMGIINTLGEIRLNATFVAETPESGMTGFLSQSGALGAAVLNSLRTTDIKFAHFISVGNKADIFENDILRFWNSDPNIKTLTFYLESFVDGKDFIEPFITGKIEKPAIVLKAGRTKSGMKAASSHTGALSGKDKVIDSLLKQFGIIRADNLNELFNTAKGFEHFPIPEGNKIALISNSGTPAVLCADKLDAEGLTLAEFSGETKSRLDAVLGYKESTGNPVLISKSNKTTYKKVIELVESDPNVDAVISIYCGFDSVSSFESIEEINRIKSCKPILQVVIPEPAFWDKYRKDSMTGLPLFKSPEDAAEVLSNMFFYLQSRHRLNKNRSEYTSLLNASPRAKIGLSGGFLPQSEIDLLLSEYNIPVIQNRVIQSIEEEIEPGFYPLVLKGINRNVIHKSEMNAVKLNIGNKNELRSAAAEIRESFSMSGFEIEGFLLQKYIDFRHELIIGGYRDPSFGPVILFGSGGKYVEIYEDIVIRSCCLSDDDIDEMIGSSAIGKRLKGFFGEEPCNIAELKGIIRSCARMMLENKYISEFDINPLILNKQNNYYAADVRIECG